MTHIPINLPLKGFTEQTAFSGVPAGMTPSCLNMMPVDVWNGRTRISTRNGTQLYNDGGIQFMGTYRVYAGSSLVERIIFVRAGKVYYADPRSSLTATEVLFGDGTTQTTAPLNTTGLVEGVQFNEHFYFVDGDHYVFVRLTTPAAANAVAVWGGVGHGPFRTDPTSVQAGERATLICRWGPRLVLAGYRRTPNLWYACAPDEPFPDTHTGGSHPTDGWTGNDILGAVSGSTYSDYGSLGDPIVSIFPFAQTGLMFACTNSFSFLTTDPLFGDSASMVSLTRSIGIAGRRAWCQSQEKGAWVLANDGLYFVNANDFNFNRANRVSAGRLDSFFLRLDFGTPATGGTGPLSGGTNKGGGTDTGDPDSGGFGGSGAPTVIVNDKGGLSSNTDPQTVGTDTASANLLGGALEEGDVFPCLCYDPDREGVWLFLSVGGVESASLHLYYDLKTDSFWPQRFSDPKIYAPISAVYVGTSRTEAGRLFMGGTSSISVIERAFPIGIDGWTSEITDEDQRKQFIRSSLTVGPILGSLPYRAFLNEVRVDLGNDEYELPSGFTDLSEPPSLTVTTGDTAQAALGIQTDSLFVTNINPLVLDGGNAAAAGLTTYDGGDKNTPSPNIVDGRYSHRPFGQYTQDDPFAVGTTRIYNGPAYWKIKWDATATPAATWVIYRPSATPPNEYQQIVPDPATPDGVMVTMHQTPVPPDVDDNASVSGASFPQSSVFEIGTLVAGRNTAQKCRIRAEAMYLTIASDGRPWSIERMSAHVSQTGKSRGGV